MPITPSQCRAARALIGWSQDQLVAALAGAVSKRTVVRFELGDSQPQSATIDAVQAALETAGVIFIPQNGEGPGVRLRRQKEE